MSRGIAQFGFMLEHVEYSGSRISDNGLSCALP